MRQIAEEDAKQPEYYGLLVDSADPHKTHINFKSTHFFGPFTSHFVSISECDISMSSCSILEARQCGMIVRDVSNFVFVDGQVRENAANGFFFPFFNKKLRLNDIESLEKKYRKEFIKSSQL